MEQEKSEIKQTRKKVEPIRFRDDAINKIRKEKIDFGIKSYKDLPLKVSKDTHQKGLFIRVYKGSPGDDFTKKVFYIRFWFNGKSDLHSCGMYSQTFGVKECDEYLIDLARTHQDPKTRFWIKSPNITRRDKNRLVEKPDSTKPKNYTINEVIIAYCGGQIYDEPAERGFSKDRREGYRSSKHAREWFRMMAGYNHRISLIKFRDDEDGYGYAEFLPNKHLRVSKPKDMTDLFRKYPPGKGILKDRVYYNRRKKQTYTIPKSQNYCIYDSNIVMEEKDFQLFWECSEELSHRFPFKAELHQFMILTAMRKTESLKMRKDYIDWDRGTIRIPKGVGKTRYRDEELPITPELEVLLHNILDMGDRPGFSFYKMKDFPWLFATRSWKAERYFNKEFRLSQNGRLGGDENYVPAIRNLMRVKSGDPNLIYAPKILRKTYITKSQQVFKGRSEITSQMSRHASIDTLNRHYNKPSIESKKAYAGEVSQVFKFIQRRTA
jgi:integrase